MSCCCTPLGPRGGGGGGAVTSVFGRTGAVVAVAGDYNSSQVTNNSGVAGASVSDALDTLASAIVAVASGSVPTSRTLAATSPIQIDGGNSADLSANRTISVLGVSNTTAGVAPAHAGAADVGKALVATPTGSQWSTNFGANDLTTTGGIVSNNASPFIRLGLAPGSGAGSAASTGAIRISASGNFLFGRTAADSGDVVLANWDGSILRFGQTTAPLSGALLLSNTEVQLRNGTNYSLKTTTTLVQINSTLSAIEGEGSLEYRVITRSGAAVTGFNATFHGGDVAAASSTGGRTILRGAAGGAGTAGPLDILAGTGTTANSSISLVAAAANFQGMQLGIFQGNASVAPSADPANGFFHWGDAGSPMWRYATNTTVKFGAAAATATAGAGTLPATPQEFWTITLNGNVRKIPLYLN